MNIKKLFLGGTISAAAFVVAIAMIAQLWVAIYFPARPRYTVHQVWTQAVNVAPSAKSEFLVHPRHGKPVVLAGVYSLDDLRDAMNDPQIAANFSGFSFATAQLVKMGESRIAFVSYWIDGRGLFWTVSPIIIAKGELVWMDDRGNVVRARCGNRVAYAPGLRVEPAEEIPQATLDEEPLALETHIAVVIPPKMIPVPTQSFLSPPPMGFSGWIIKRRHHPNTPPTTPASLPIPRWQIGGLIFGVAWLVRNILNRNHRAN